MLLYVGLFWIVKYTKVYQNVKLLEQMNNFRTLY